MGWPSAGGLEELLEDLEQAGEWGVGFRYSLDEAGGVSSLCEGGIALAQAGESIVESDFLEGMEGSLTAWCIGDRGDEVEVETAAEGRFRSGCAAGECGDAAMLLGEPANDEAGFRERVGAEEDSLVRVLHDIGRGI